MDLLIYYISPQEKIKEIDNNSRFKKVFQWELKVIFILYLHKKEIVVVWFKFLLFVQPCELTMFSLSKNFVIKLNVIVLYYKQWISV